MHFRLITDKEMMMMTWLTIFISAIRFENKCEDEKKRFVY